METREQVHKARTGLVLSTMTSLSRLSRTQWDLVSLLHNYTLLIKGTRIFRSVSDTLVWTDSELLAASLQRQYVLSSQYPRSPDVCRLCSTKGGRYPGSAGAECWGSARWIFTFNLSATLLLYPKKSTVTYLYFRCHLVKMLTSTMSPWSNIAFPSRTQLRVKACLIGRTRFAHTVGQGLPRPTLEATLRTDQ